MNDKIIIIHIIDRLQNLETVLLVRLINPITNKFNDLNYLLIDNSKDYDLLMINLNEQESIFESQYVIDDNFIKNNQYFFDEAKLFKIELQYFLVNYYINPELSDNVFIQFHLMN